MSNGISSYPQERGLGYYGRVAASGAIAANLTHIVLVPVDDLKTRMQINPSIYPSFATARRLIVSTEGLSALSLGFGPTFVGYAIQGAFKYGLYEAFKASYTNMVGQDLARQHTSAVYLSAGMTAELIADIGLTPFEAIRIRLVSQPQYASGTFTGLACLYQHEGLAGWYRGFVPLVLKQVPYTAVKFCVFEHTLRLIDGCLSKPRSELAKYQQLGITFVAGLVGGVASAVVSHPADTLLTAVNAKDSGSTGMPEKKGSTGVLRSLVSSAKTLGWSGIWAGLFPRMGMVGILAAFQLWVFDSSKLYIFGMRVSQGIPMIQREP